MKLSIVIPAYNEQDTIEDVILSIDNKYPYSREINDLEVIVVNDASTDKTLTILGALKAKMRYIKIVNNKKNSGHAYSVIKGLKEATGDYIIYMDADNQIRLDDFSLEPYDFDLISGYRVDRHDKPFRKIVSFILKMTILLRHGLWIKDANCPMKVFKRVVLQDLLISLPFESIVPSISMEIIARKFNKQVVEVPFIHHPYIKERTGSLQSINKKSLSMFYKAFKEVWTI